MPEMLFLTTAFSLNIMMINMFFNQTYITPTTEIVIPRNPRAPKIKAFIAKTLLFAVSTLDR